MDIGFLSILLCKGSEDLSIQVTEGQLLVNTREKNSSSLGQTTELLSARLSLRNKQYKNQQPFTLRSSVC